MKKITIRSIVLSLSTLAFTGLSSASSRPPYRVIPFESDRQGTHLVAAEWKSGIGCPTDATTFDGQTFASYTDPGCSTGDVRDRLNLGLLLAKTGPSNNQAQAGANINGVQGKAITELGYDLRKPEGTSGARGSHCGQFGPYFHIVLSDGSTRDVPCFESVPEGAAVNAASAFWQRLRWFFPGGITVSAISIIFNDGQDVPPDNFGLAVLDNIDINGTLVGRGPTDDDEGGGADTERDEFAFHDSPSHPGSSGMEYHDRSGRMNLESTNGVSSIAYSGTCVSFAGNALLNGNPGYAYTFAACDLSGLGTGIGSFNITITGPAGFLYQKSAVMTSGFVQIAQ